MAGASSLWSGTRQAMVPWPTITIAGIQARDLTRGGALGRLAQLDLERAVPAGCSGRGEGQRRRAPAIADLDRVHTGAVAMERHLADRHGRASSSSSRGPTVTVFVAWSVASTYSGSPARSRPGPEPSPRR